MSETAGPTWQQLQQLMIYPPSPEPVIRGEVTSHQRKHYVGFGLAMDEAPPLIVAPTAGRHGALRLSVVRAGALLRVEYPDGSPYFVAGERKTWLFSEPGIPDEDEAAREQYVGAATALFTRPDHERFNGTDFTTPTGPITPTTFLGRAAWQLELAPPSHKPHPLQWVVDAETGLLLQERNDGFGFRSQWESFEVGGDADPSLFVWTGPVHTVAERAAEHWAEHEQEMRDRRSWFETNIAPLPLTVTLTQLSSINVHTREPDGSFVGHFDEPTMGSIARRPVGRTHDLVEADWGTSYTWRSGGFVWRVTFPGLEMSLEALADLQRQLGAEPD